MMDKSAVQEISRLDHFKANFKTTILSEFTKYITHYASDDTGVFIDQETMSALAIIDMGAQSKPFWGKHRATVSLVKTPALTALLKLNNAHLPQQAIIDFFEDWIGNIKFYFDDEKREESFAQTLESIEITAGSAELPAGFWFEAIPYEGFKKRVFTCQLRAVNDDKNVVLKYRISQQEAINVAIASEFREYLTVNLLDVKTFIGTMAYQI